MFAFLRYRLPTGAAIASLLLTSVAAAADTPAPAAAAAPAPLAQTLTGAAKTSYEGAKLLFEDHDYAGAATKYRAAYDASHDPRLLWNIAACEKEMRHYARASMLVDRFLKDAASQIGPDVLAQARATQAALREFFSPARLNVQPAGALVLVDGDELGRAPFAEPVPIDLGKHVVRVEKDGFAPSETRLDVAGQSAVTIDVALKAIETTAFVDVRPSGPNDAVAVDDKIVASGPWQGPLPPGKHRVKVSADGKRAYVAEIDLGQGEHRTIQVTLEDEKKKAIWPWLVGGGAVVVAGGAIAGYFLLKPSDTEGPAPAGKLGTVFIDSTHAGRRR